MWSSRYAVDVYHRKDADTDFELIGRFQLDGNRNVVVLAVDDVWGDFLRGTADMGLVDDSGSRRISAHHGPKFLEVVLRFWGGRHDAVGVRAERVELKKVGADGKALFLGKEKTDQIAEMLALNEAMLSDVLRRFRQFGDFAPGAGKRLYFDDMKESSWRLMNRIGNSPMFHPSQMQHVAPTIQQDPDLAEQAERLTKRWMLALTALKRLDSIANADDAMRSFDEWLHSTEGRGL